MITDALLRVFDAILGWFVGLLPTWSIGVPSGFASVVQGLGAWDSLLPVTESFVIVALVGSVFAGAVAMKWFKQVIDWVADIIP
jgi:hypothetical protein